MTPGTAQVKWRHQANRKAAKVTKYRVVVAPSGETCRTTLKKLVFVVKSLTPGLEYTFKNEAGNRIGWSEEVTTRSFTNPLPAPQPEVAPTDPTEVKPDPEFS